MSLPEALKKELDYGNKILKEFFAESDRSAAVLMGAELDIQLERVLSHFLLPPLKKSSPLLQQDGPLGSFSARIEMVYRIGLIPDDWHHDLHVIRKIRNEFAHGPTGLDFTQPPVCDLASNLIIGRGVIDDMMRGKKPPPDPKAPYAPKNVFRLSCSYFLPHMILLRYNTPKMQPLWKRFMKSISTALRDNTKKA
jgi:Mannitol repressor